MREVALDENPKLKWACDRAAALLCFHCDIKDKRNEPYCESICLREPDGPLFEIVSLLWKDTSEWHPAFKE